MAEQPASDDERSRRGASTIIFALATSVSRVAGLVREVAVSATFGVSAQLSAFTIAIQIPNLIRSLVADSALTAAFVPVFSELRVRGEEERAWRVASTIIGVILLVLGPLCVLAAIFSPQIVGLVVDQDALGTDGLRLTVELTRLFMPIVLMMALSGVVVGVLHSYDHFGAAALAPVAWNAVIVTAVLVGGAVAPADDRIWWYAGGMLLGTAVQALFPVPWLRGRGGRLRLRLSWRDPRVREIFVLMLPVTVSLGLINLQQLVGTAFATHVPASWFPDGVDPGGGPAIVDRAFRLYLLPQGVFSVAISTVFFPALARHAARADMAAFRATFADGLRQIFLLLLPSAALLAVLAEPIVRLLFQYGNFTAADTPVVADAVAAFSIGLVLNGAALLLIRAFFSLRRTWLPTAVSLITLIVSVATIAALYRPYGTTGIALATSVVNVVQFGVLYVLLRRTAGRLETGRSLRVVLPALVVAGIAAAAAAAAHRGVEHVLGLGLLAQLVAMLVAVLVCFGLYFLTVVRLGLVDGAVLRRLTRRRR